MANAYETSLPASLQNDQDLAKIRQAVTQWSRLVAWSWTPILAFKDDEIKAPQEKALKKYFIEILQKQCQGSFGYESYADDEALEQAKVFSSYYKYLQLGENEKIPYLKENRIAVTLSDVLLELSGETYILTADKEFTQMFEFRVITDFTGTISQVVDDKGDPVPDQYIAREAYPPRPALSEATVTEQQLFDWAQNINTGGNYLPPSVYIPIAGS